MGEDIRNRSLVYSYYSTSCSYYYCGLNTTIVEVTASAVRLLEILRQKRSRWRGERR